MVKYDFVVYLFLLKNCRDFKELLDLALHSTPERSYICTLSSPLRDHAAWHWIFYWQTLSFSLEATHPLADNPILKRNRVNWEYFIKKTHKKYTYYIIVIYHCVSSYIVNYMPLKCTNCIIIKCIDTCMH